MSKNKFFQEYAARFAAASNQSLVESFNKEVGITGWTSMRASFIAALINEFLNRGIDISAVNDGRSTDFNHHVRLDETGKRFILID
ncbi:MAG: hypothetical protein IJU24_07690 [Bacteroidaceae bacterium]|jgi:hypothetical protein|nr:hypothetical protein [Bacteroidaceae bacterium]